jgi:hypothetical protein
MTFPHILSIGETGQVFSSFIKSDQQTNNAATGGNKFTLTEKIKALFRTFILKFTSKLDNQESTMQSLDRVVSPGSQLNNIAVQQLMQKLAGNPMLDEPSKANFNTSFLPRQGSINDMTETQISTEIQKLPLKPNLPTLIPVIVSGQEMFESQHIVLITVKGQDIEFYDPKGILSHNYSIGNGKTLNDLIFDIRTKMDLNGKIHQNPYRNQMDINNCGVNVCERARKIMNEDQKLGDFEDKTYSFAELRQFRTNILNTYK